MLIDFSVKNFRSIRNLLTLSMTADTKLTEKKEVLLSFRKLKVLPEVMILGPNGAGKSTLLQAVKAALSIIDHSAGLKPGDSIEEIVPYLFDEQTPGEPSFFQFTFTMGDQKYVYGFSATKEAVAEEFLYHFKTERASKVFERDGQDFSYGAPYKNRLAPLEERTSENKLLLAAGAAWNDPLCKKIVHYLTRSILVESPSTIARVGHAILMNSDGLDAYKEKMISLLMESDLSISDFSLKPESVNKDEFLEKASIPDAMKELVKGLPVTAFMEDRSTTIHKVNGREYSLLFESESEGTKNFFNMLPVLFNALEYGKTVMIDELETNLHPLLIQIILRLFEDPSSNKNQAQLIFTTHDVLLLGTKLLRRDQILFIEKNHKKQETDLYSLADFSPRKDGNYLKNYLIGRYGAIPNLGILEGADDFE